MPIPASSEPRSRTRTSNTCRASFTSAAATSTFTRVSSCSAIRCAIGGAGHISATANIFPREVADIYNHVAAGRWEKAIELHYYLLEINDMIFFETNPGPLKFAMGELGRINPSLRPPMCEPSEANQQRIRKVLADYGLDKEDG